MGYTLDNVDPKFLLLPRYESGNLKLHLPHVMDCTCSMLHYFSVVMWSQINPCCLKLLLSCPCSKRKRNTIERNSQRNLEGTPHYCNQPLQLATVPTSWRYRNKCRKWLVLSLTFGLSWTAPVEAPVPSVSSLWGFLVHLLGKLFHRAPLAAPSLFSVCLLQANVHFLLTWLYLESSERNLVYVLTWERFVLLLVDVGVPSPLWRIHNSSDIESWTVWKKPDDYMMASQPGSKQQLPRFLLCFGLWVLSSEIILCGIAGRCVFKILSWVLILTSLSDGL